MRLLLDTHAILWFWWNDSFLSPSAKALIVDPTNIMLISHASPWEVSIKVSQQKLDLGRPFAGYFPDQMTLTDMEYLPTTDEHFAELSVLPFHHRDPFDRPSHRRTHPDREQRFQIRRLSDSTALVRRC